MTERLQTETSAPLPSLRGRTVVVTGAAAPLGPALARTLAAAGASVALTGDVGTADERAVDPAPAPVESGAVVRVSSSYGTEADAAQAFDLAQRAFGRPVDALVHAEVPDHALEPCPLSQVDESRWAVVWEAGFLATLRCCQAAYRHMAGRGGRIVLVTPTLALTGAAGLAPYAALAEAQRAMAKSAARQWGGDGITVNCLAPGTEALLDDGEASDAVALAPPALPPISPEAALGPTTAFLVSAESAHLTGATLCVDGGVWMP